MAGMSGETVGSPIMPRTPNGIRWALHQLALRAGARVIEPLEGDVVPSILADGIALRYGAPRGEAESSSSTISAVSSGAANRVGRSAAPGRSGDLAAPAIGPLNIDPPPIGHPTIWIVPCAIDAPTALLTLQPGDLPSCASADLLPPMIGGTASATDSASASLFDVDERIPVPLLAAGELLSHPIPWNGSSPRMAARIAFSVPGGAVLRADIVATALMFLSRWEETVSSVRDEHGRFPASASFALRHRILDRPLVDEHALVLRAWMRAVLPGWTPAARVFDIRLSHDIDRIRPFRGPEAALRRLFGDLLRRRNPATAMRSLRDAVTQAIALERTSSFMGIEELGAIAAAADIPAAFLFQAGDPGPFDSDYDVRREPVAGVIRRLRDAGHSVGLHPSYAAADDPARLSRERERLAAVSPEPVRLSRQHYLRFTAPETWRALESAGLECDMSLGYADHEGFRAGTCHPYQPFDLERDVIFGLVEEPLIAMESTLLSYRELSTDEAAERVYHLAQSCRRVGGRMTLLWHNSKLHGGWEAWGECYRGIVPVLAAMRSERD